MSYITQKIDKQGDSVMMFGLLIEESGSQLQVTIK
jgi:hypothetical protein